MNVWTVAREYAGIAEAGGVKNVTCSISESLAKQGQNVTLFIPLYGCTDLSEVEDFNCLWHKPVIVNVQQKDILVTFSHGIKNGVEIVFIGNRRFSEKKAVYTYTRAEEIENPSHKHGSGHEDALFLNTIFQKAVVSYGLTCSEKEKPDIIHCHDATAAMIPVFLEERKKNNQLYYDFYRKTKSIVTIHNAGSGYHHEYSSLGEAAYLTGLSEEILSKGLNNGRVEPFLLSAENSCMTTVSPEYAKEILDGRQDSGGLATIFRERNIEITGITNGIDFERYNPEKTEMSALPFEYNPIGKDFSGKYKCRRDLVLKYASKSRTVTPGVTQYGYLSEDSESDVFITYHGRIVRQKGINVMLQATRRLISENSHAKFIFIGQGEPELEEAIINLVREHEGNCVFFNGYDKALSRLCIASADFAVMPSEFEPCGTEDFIAQIFGTIPVAHATGGLNKILNDETGFLYDENTPENLSYILGSLIKISINAGNDFFDSMKSFAASYIKDNYSWKKVGELYLSLYFSNIFEKN